MRLSKQNIRCPARHHIALILAALIVLILLKGGWNHYKDLSSLSYGDICYVTVSNHDDCVELCKLDSLCFYTHYYPNRRAHNCFTQLFYRDSEPRCTPVNATNVIIDVKSANTTGMETFENKTVVNTPLCRRPNYHPFHNAVAKIINRNTISKPYSCNKQDFVSRFEITDSDHIKLKSGQKGDSCGFRYIVRDPGYQSSDSNSNTTDWVTLTQEGAELTDEFIEVQCNDTNNKIVYRDYASHVPIKLAESRSDMAASRRLNVSHTRRFKERLNVVMFGIDSTSVSQGYRLLPRTLGYLRQKMNSISFKGYNRVQDNTFMNLYPLLTGIPILESIGTDATLNRFYDKDPLVFKWFKNAGFVTAYYEDYTRGALFNWLKKGFQYSPADHYSKPFSLNVERNAAQKWFTDFCYLAKGVHEWVGDWLKTFMHKYLNLKSPQFVFAWTTLISHEHIDMLGQGDIYYYNLLRHLEENKLLENTVFVFMSDHGYRYGGLRATNIGQHEEDSPMMHWVLPRWFNKKYEKEMMNLKTNAHHRITSVFDIHRTLLDFADGALESAKAAGMRDYGKSLFEPIDEKRKCADAGISDHFCGCRSTVPSPIDDPLFKDAAQAIVRRINDLTYPETPKCIVYELRKILAAYKHERHDVDGVTEVAVTVSMKHSVAEFSSTVHLFPNSTKAPEVKGISRVSLYGYSANCVNDAHMRLFCTCK